MIASGRKAAGMALALATWTRKLVVCTNGVPLERDRSWYERLQNVGVMVTSERIERLVTHDSAVRALELESGVHLDCERIFFAIGQYPADDLGDQLGCERDDDGLIVVGAHGHTSVPNVFAAGDITPGPHLTIRAAATGAVAALSIHHSLLPASLVLD